MPSTRPSKDDIDACRRCDLWKRATQGVPGQGGRRARVLRTALAEAGIPHDDVFLTNAVKHFSWEPRGMRRIHKTPTQQQIAACMPT